MNDLNMKEEKLAARQKLMENVFEKFQLEQNEVEIIRKSAEKRFEEMKLKEKQLEMQSEELDLTRDRTGRLAGLLDCKEKNVKVREKIVDSKEKELELIKSRLDCKEKELEEREKRVDLKKIWSQLKVAREQIENELEEEKLEGRNKETISGQKRTMPFSSGREFKRLATAKAVGEPMKGCRKILDELKKNDQEQKKTILHIQHRVSDMHSKMMDLMKAGKALEEEYNELKKQGPPMTQAAKQQIIEEYKRVSRTN